MKENRKALVPADPAPPPDSPDSPDIPHEAATLGDLVFVSEVEEDAYWRGVNSGLRMGGESGVTIVGRAAGPLDPDAPIESRRVRRARWDGFTGPKQATFLERIAEGATVAQAADAAGISPQAAYNLRNRRSGRAFNIGWEAACRRARRPLADRLHDRSIAGQTEILRDSNHVIVGTRHRHDNRLAMAMLTRLDRKVEAYREDERLVTSVAEEFEELLDCIEEGGDADDFIRSRTPVRPTLPQALLPRIDRKEVESRRIAHRYDKVDPADIDISDLHRDEIRDWDLDQLVRADRSGLLDRLEEEGKAQIAAHKAEKRARAAEGRRDP